MFNLLAHIKTKLPTNIQFFWLFLVLVLPNSIYSQEVTEVITRRDITPKTSFFKSIKFTGAPIYSPYTGLGVTGMATATYNLKRGAKDIPPSYLSLNATVTSTGYVIVGLQGANYTKRARWQALYNLVYHNIPADFWGLGYYNGENGVKGEVDREHFYGDLTILYNAAPNLHIGPSVGFDWITTEGYTTKLLNWGAIARYDTRDFAPNPYSGTFLHIRQQNYTNLQGKPAFRSSGQLNFYHRIFENTILAYDLYSEFNYGASQWTMMAMIGGNNRMRGYYKGRYRDRNMVTAQMEIRQRIWRPVGAVAWVGGGNVWGEDKFNWGHTLPNYGVGLRVEIKERINLRFDYGFGKNRQNCFIFGINEAF